MTRESEVLGVDERRVVHETIDGETILIRLDTGTYYSLAGSASAIWALLTRGVPVGRAAELLAARHPEEAGAVADAVRAFAEQLVAEDLLAPVGQAPAPPADVEAPPTDAPFVPPALQRYTDMEYFLLLDPVHDVDASAGWPEPAPEAVGH